MKLIIDIDKKVIQQAKHYHDLPYDDYVIQVAEAIANGTPLDDIKAEIADIYVGYRHGYEIRKDALEIIDKHIGKE